MPLATVLIDGNNFYASCEAALDPVLIGRPLVVLSNNDGCIVARSAEARALGIAMGTPYFQVRRQLERQGVVVRSSNYALYADMSQRLMATLEPWVEELEIYSIDEAFGRLHRPAGGDLTAWGQALRRQVRRHLGLPVAVGIAASKTQAKLANRLAKRSGYPAGGERAGQSLGVFDLGAVADPDLWLEQVPVEEVWGIGRKLSRWCRLRGIANARQLRDLPSGELRARCGVVGLRLQQELRGHSCLLLQSVVPAKQETCVSRSFSEPVTSLAALREAIATYLSRAAEKLRRQRQRAGTITVFVRSSPFNGTSFYANAATVSLPLASQDTAVLLAAALPLAARLFRPHKPLQKAGVLLQNLQPVEQLQHHLLVPLSPEQQQRREALMATIDGLNRRYGRGTVQWAACGLRPSWAMKRERLSGATTTRLADLPVVLA
ncbi:Y-family DNA polymerase [Synechococcus sp. CS-1324]|uniref:Y-family DNA polymerase n=1 Tax=unclassified Synechococcus TaxID=2626047 RepID=UPI000DB83ABF|nr:MULTISPECIES: Y-family DNA polymerase [unclassified Synechococcus]MCT0213940.1 Y-family DNA polymerase [Synechococcus sp. CS-1326]MCT0230842.1 Y-family DNA polymerase [Synechococcus sp. CS-1324]MCT0233516.1 Y-family DNA polymerase [Synechococcus sp. CS-1327]PZV03367.1 MAG: nucleotidyltransferase [Cyanobium sp.]